MERSTRVPQRVLLVGGSSEIGSALALAWLRRGTREFVVSERSDGRARQLVDELRSGGAKVDTVVLDALDSATITSAIEQTWRGGDIDVSVIAMGVLGSQEEMEESPAKAWEVLTVNATATIQTALEIAGRMEVQQHGTMVLLSSVAGQRGRRDNYVYGASKAALDTVAEGLQQRFARSDVNVLVVRPGYVHSRMSADVEPAPFSVSVESSRNQILRAVEQRRDVVWVPPVLKYVFATIRLLPRRIWAKIVLRMR
jgi:decaprenylphospho-beta-D-erythro-pentofuranosid-2-ulose 2-reductase